MLLASSVWARDPFLSAQVERCATATWIAPGGKLQGVIGRPGHFEAWLLLPGGKRLHVKPNDNLPGTRWRVTYIDLQRVSLAEASACQPQTDLVFKGEHHVKENGSDSDSTDR